MNLLNLKHPAIAEYKEILVDRSTVTIIQDFFDAPTLFQFIVSQRQYFSEKIIASIATQILEAL